MTPETFDYLLEKYLKGETNREQERYLLNECLKALGEISNIARHFKHDNN